MSFLMGQCHLAFAQHSSILLTVFLAGLVGGFTHCAGMCGPFVLAQCGDKSEPSLQRDSGLLLPYHLGRMTTYMTLGAIAALLSKQIMGTPLQQSVSFTFLTLAGVIFIASALPQLKIKLLSIPMGGFGKVIGKLARPFLHKSDGLSGYSLGVLLGFLPCGLIFAALMVVSTTGNPFSAALAMMLFALATIPALALVGLGGKFALHKWPETTRTFTRAVMVGNGISLFALAGKMIV
ncbi:MAG: sulfite exporter TauE/SafE family protein [Rickettsiales bacterium]|nr:sulfite exporter TauE/SafE family protein [Rickettsiales bacterium]